MFVKPKKFLGQHFLKDENIAQKIVNSLSFSGYDTVLEVGSGTGVLTKYLTEKPVDLYAIDVDEDSIKYLKDKFLALQSKIINDDFLRIDLSHYFSDTFAIIGNFPYNISSQILFKVLSYRNQIPEVVGMFQKEVAERIVAQPKTKAYGILSVLMQTYYKVEYLFTVSEKVFIPPPKVKSGVIRCSRNTIKNLSCDEKLYFEVIKTSFNQRRKTLRNAIKKLLPSNNIGRIPFLSLRAEELSCKQFEELTTAITESRLQ